MTKKGQITFFIFLGILILFSLWILTSEKSENYLGSDPIIQAVTAFTQGCHDQTSREAVFYLGLIGGRPMQWPSYFVYDEFYKIPHYYYDGINVLTQKPLDALLETSVESLLPRCTSNFGSFKAKIKSGTPKSNVILTPEEVIITTTYPINIYEPINRNLQNDFVTHIPIPMQKYNEYANSIISFVKQNEYLIPWGLLDEINKKGIKATAYIEKDKNIIYRFVDENNKLFNEPYVFQFGVKQ